MTPKAKAKEMVDVMHFNIPDHCDDWDNAKRLAIIAVDYIIESMPTHPEQSRPMKRSNGTDMVMTHYPAILYWNEVRFELDKSLSDEMDTI